LGGVRTGGGQKGFLEKSLFEKLNNKTN